MATHGEREAMSRAVDAAGESIRTLPNPRVAAAILDPLSERTIAVGIHRGAGSAHAEAEALAQAGEHARGATAVITLEPCHHAGRTPPCTRALIDAGITRVVYGQSDPNPSASGGAAALKAAGISVEAHVLQERASALNREWTFAVTHGRPHVTWKYAATLDGFSAAADGTSRWISGLESRRDTHLHRAESDVVMAGTGTIVTDNPQLTARVNDVALPYEHQPTRVVVGTRDLPGSLAVFDDVAPTLRIRSRDPAEVLAALAERQFRRVWLEGGPRLAGAFVQTGFIDEVLCYLAPAMLGAGLPALVTSATTLDQLRALTIEDVSRSGDDIRLVATFATGEESRCLPE